MTKGDGTMMKAIAAAIRNKKITFVMAAAVMIFGLYNYGCHHASFCHDDSHIPGGFP